MSKTFHQRNVIQPAGQTLTIEILQAVRDKFRDIDTQPHVEIVSPAEYMRRGMHFKLLTPEEWVAWNAKEPGQ